MASWLTEMIKPDTTRLPHNASKSKGLNPGRQGQTRLSMTVRTNLKAGRWYIRLKFGEPSWRERFEEPKATIS